MATLTVDEAEYMALIEKCTEQAIERVDEQVNHNLDPDVLREEVPLSVDNAVSFFKFEDSRHTDLPGYLAGGDIFGSRNWDTSHSIMFYASLVEADMSLFTNTDGRELDCEAWRTHWQWFADSDRFDHTKDKPSGPVSHSTQWEAPNNPFRAIRYAARGLFTARVYDRVARHFGDRMEAAEGNSMSDGE